MPCGSDPNGEPDFTLPERSIFEQAVGGTRSQQPHAGMPLPHPDHTIFNMRIIFPDHHRGALIWRHRPQMIGHLVPAVPRAAQGDVTLHLLPGLHVALDDRRRSCRRTIEGRFRRSAGAVQPIRDSHRPRDTARVVGSATKFSSTAPVSNRLDDPLGDRSLPAPSGAASSALGYRSGLLKASRPSACVGILGDASSCARRPEHRDAAPAASAGQQVSAPQSRASDTRQFTSGR